MPICAIAETAPESLVVGRWFGFAVLIASGICFLIWFVVVLRRLARGQAALPPPYRRLQEPWPLTVDASLVLLWLIAMVVGQLLIAGSGLVERVTSARYPDTTDPMPVVLGFGYLVLVWAAVRKYGRDGRLALGLTMKGFLRSALLGGAAYLVLIGACAAVLKVTTMLMERAGLQPKILEPLQELNTASELWLLVVAIIKIGILIPFFEEFFFRGILQRMATRVIPSVWAILVTSAAFAMAHGSQPQGMPSIFLLSLGLGYVFYRSGSLIAPWIMHSVFNTVFLIAAWLA